MEWLFDAIATATKPETIKCGLYDGVECNKNECAECCRKANLSNNDE